MTATAKVQGYPLLREGTFKGIARCTPEDQFDLEKGKRIAESKATKKLYNRLTSSLNRELREVFKDVDFFKNELMRMADLKQAEEKHFEEILG